MKLELTGNYVKSCSSDREACLFEIDEHLAMDKWPGDFLNVSKHPFQCFTVDYPLDDDDQIVRALE